MENGKIIKLGEDIYRILSVKEEKTLLIDCKTMTMPKWKSIEDIREAVPVSETECDILEAMPSEVELSQKEIAVAHHRFSLIAPVLSVLDDDKLRSSVINKICSDNHISRRTLTDYLCRYLVYGEIAVLAGNRNHQEKELTADQKNMRWALNKFYYTRHKNSLADSYIMMLKAKYTDSEGTLAETYPSIHQFRYFYKKYNKRQTEIISREGIKEYSLNYRPLLGEGVHDLAPVIGYGMLDGTVCDIYLVDEAGNLIGRPVLLANCDAYSSLCMGYSLLWEGGVYSVRELMLNTITDKVEWCRRFGIEITAEQWPSCELPGVLVTDRGSEYISFNFEQITELGCQLISLPSFSANLKGPVEKLFDLVQESYKPYLKGKGVIEPDFQKRGAKDYRKEACLTIEQFEKIVIHCIIYHNCQRILESFPFTEQMLENQVRPYASDIWNYSVSHGISNLISVTKEKLVLTLLPRTEARFTRKGLVANKLRYGCDRGINHDNVR